MTPVELSRTVLHAVRRAVDDGELSVTVPERAVVTEPGPGGCGDFATTIALQLARPAGLPGLRVAEILRARLAEAEGVRDVVVTGRGFLNICLDEQVDPVAGLVREIREKGTRYGYGDALAGQVVELRVPYEVRAEVVADAVVRLVATQGGRATVEHGEPVNLRPVPAPEDPAPLGPDAARWALLHPAPHDRPRITADHLIQRESNPLFRVRYAHARIRALSRNAARLGFRAEPGPVGLGAPPGAGPLGIRGRGGGRRPGASTEAAGDPFGISASAGGRSFLGALTQADADADAFAAPANADTCLPALGALAHADAGPFAAPANADTCLPALGSPAHAEAGPLATRAKANADLLPPENAGPAPLTPVNPGTDSLAVPTTAGDAERTPTVATPTPLLAPLAAHPRILAVAATRRAPDRLARHLVTVADAVLPLLPCVLPVGEEKPSAAHRARLALAEAAGTVLAGGLALLGIDAPEHL
ncbi:ArgS-related anticodon-binding protein NrtL [Streptomyces sp. NPDC017673]|uniref:ArgS-related anticodon-binding protein NrtL n=1 Tax=unclassified Streptomyces TaxID=2593676 RepID=UPI00378DFE20